MMLNLCFLVVVLCFHHVISQDPVLVMSKYASEDVSLFKQWMVEHRRSYKTVEEHESRLEAFLKNLHTIRNHNLEGNSWQMGLNEFSDLTYEEFSAVYTGTPQDCSATRSESLIPFELPQRKDWREEGNFVTHVKNQGHCGSCWTFSTTGCLESATAIHGKGHHLYTLSEQQLVDCAIRFDNFGCNGGLPSHAFEYIMYNKGLESETDYPYTGKNGSCAFQPEEARGFVRGVVNITQNDEDSIVAAVANMNPVSVAFQVTSDFQHYKSGVYSNPHCGTKPTQVNHAVLAVGYDTDSTSGKDYWIIKNSWGTTWGQKGYFYMQRGVNMCGVATCASYPLVP